MAALYVSSIGSYVVQIAPADTSTLKTIASASSGGKGVKIEAMIATSTETASARDLQFVITLSAVDYIIDTITCPVNSGFTNSAVALNVLGNATKFLWANRDAGGNPYLYIPPGGVLKVKSLTTLNTGKVISVYAQGGELA
ncbi:MAG: hypothetical protein EBR82_22980 [Caulobacteraceae bacterium]|nr:hypothetical protein [Caulobacteraceae bacterium]